MIAYVKTQGARITKKGNTLQVKKENAVLNTLFLHRLRQLIVYGNIDITSDAVRILLKEEVDVVFLNSRGSYLGRLLGKENKNIFLHKKQFDLTGDTDFGLSFAKSVVIGKLTNMSTLLARIKRTRSSNDAQVLSNKIYQLIRDVQTATSIDSIRGYEGKGTQLFFTGFRYGFINDWGFTKRVRRPPTDPVNAVLSLLYTFLTSRMYSVVQQVGLQPNIGFLHTLEYGRASLVLDLIEEYRSILCETLTLSLFNLKIISKDDFIYEPVVDSEDEGKPVNSVIMEGGALSRVIEQFERKIETEIFYPSLDRKITYGESMREQVLLYRQLLNGEVNSYSPMLLQ